MEIRLAQESDLPQLATLFRQTVLVHAPTYYTPDQTAAWAASPDNKEHFYHFILGVSTFVAVDDTGILGFAGIDRDGHVASAYVRHNRLHQGIGSSLMQVVLDYAQTLGIQRLCAEASDFSIGLFHKFGFRLYDTEVIEHQGIQFQRYLVELQG